MRHPPSARLSEYLDGGLPDKEARGVEQHLLACRACSVLFQELEAVQTSARDLSEQLPPRDLWPEIVRALEGSGGEEAEVIRLHPERLAPASNRSRRLLRLSVPQAVAAGLALVLVSGSLGVLLSRPPSPSGAPELALEHEAPWEAALAEAPPEARRLAAEVARLEEIVALYRHVMGPTTARVLERNLEVMDQAIQESYAALRADPESSFLEGHLTRAVQAKAEYLREATDLVAPVT
jgi:anti-sigma factor RsiW